MGADMTPSMNGERDVAILGVGMHPWGKWGHDFTEYGMVAARAALDDASLTWRDMQYVAGADTIRNGYPGFIAGATFAQKLGWTGVRVSSNYAACASGASALHQARAQILAGFCEVALVIGADTAPKGFFAPVGGERRTDPDWLRFHLLGATNPVYFALYARRRMDLYGATAEDFAQVKVKNSRHGMHNPNARFRQENTVADVVNSPVVADPLRLLDICATSDGGAAIVVSSIDFARKQLGRLDGIPRVRGVDGHASLPADGARDARLRHRLERGGSAPRARIPRLDRRRGVRGGRHRARRPEPGRGLRPLHRARARLVREHRPVRQGRGGGAAPFRCDHRWRPHSGEPERRAGVLRRGDPRPGDRAGVRGHLAASGQANGRQVEGATVGITANQGLFGHGSSVIVTT